MAQTWVTTMDNPWDFFTHFDEWYAFDKAMGYNTPEYVARIAMCSTDMSQAEYEDAVEAAVDDICRLNITGNYRKVVKKEDSNKVVEAEDILEDEEDEEDEEESEDK